MTLTKPSTTEFPFTLSCGARRVGLISIWAACFQGGSPPEAWSRKMLPQLSAVVNLLGNGTVLLDDNLVHVERGLDGVGLLVDPLELLQSTTLRFDTRNRSVSFGSDGEKTGDKLTGIADPHTRRSTRRQPPEDPSRRRSRSSWWRYCRDRWARQTGR